MGRKAWGDESMGKSYGQHGLRVLLWLDLGLCHYLLVRSLSSGGRRGSYTSGRSPPGRNALGPLDRSPKRVCGYLKKPPEHLGQ